jgi:hypothetical protein
MSTPKDDVLLQARLVNKALTPQTRVKTAQLKATRNQEVPSGIHANRFGVEMRRTPIRSLRATSRPSSGCLSVRTATLLATSLFTFYFLPRFLLPSIATFLHASIAALSATLVANTLLLTFVGFGTNAHGFEGIIGKTSDPAWVLIRTRTTLRLHCPASVLGAQRFAKVQQHRVLACTRVLHRRRVPVVPTAYHKRERVVRAAAPLPSR